MRLRVFARQNIHGCFVVGVRTGRCQGPGFPRRSPSSHVRDTLLLAGDVQPLPQRFWGRIRSVVNVALGWEVACCPSNVLLPFMVRPPHFVGAQAVSSQQQSRE